MINFGIHCNDPSQVLILKRHIKSFFYLNNLRNNLLGSITLFETLEEYITTKRNIHILLCVTPLPNKDYILHFKSHLTSINPNTHIIFIVNFIDFTLNGFNLTNLNFLLLPLDYSFFRCEMLKYLSKLEDKYKISSRL